MSDRNETTALVRRDEAQYGLAEIERMGKTISESGLFGLRNPAAATTLLLLAQADGIHPMAAVRRYHIIENKPSMKYDAMLAEFINRGGSVVWDERSNQRAAATFTFGKSVLPVEWTIDDAARAGLAGKDNWKKYPRQMLAARVISEGVRAVCPMVNFGVYTPEEVQDADYEIVSDRPAAPLFAERATAAQGETARPVEVEVEECDGPAPVNIEDMTREDKFRKFTDLVGGKEKHTLAWLIRHKWITPEQGFNDVSDARLNTILTRPAAFLASVNNEAAANA